MKEYDHAKLYGLKPVNKSAKVVTGQAGVTDTVEITALEARKQMKALKKRGHSGAIVHRGEKTSTIGSHIKLREIEECDLWKLKVGDPFLVFKANGELAYADVVRTLNAASLRGHKHRRAFTIKYGREPTNEFYARASWPE